MKPEIAKQLEALGAETAEDRRLAEKEARQKEALDYYRKHGEPPPVRTSLGMAWAVWVANGDRHDPEFVKAARALGWLPLDERTAARKKEALDCYREHGKPPKQGTLLGVTWSHSVSKGKRRDPDFIEKARALGWLPWGERNKASKEAAFSYYKEHGRPPPQNTMLGSAWAHAVSKGTRHDPDFIKRAIAAGWNPQSVEK